MNDAESVLGECGCTLRRPEFGECWHRASEVPGPLSSRSTHPLVENFCISSRSFPNSNYDEPTQIKKTNPKSQGRLTGAFLSSPARMPSSTLPTPKMRCYLRIRALGHYKPVPPWGRGRRFLMSSSHSTSDPPTSFLLPPVKPR